MNSRTKGKVGEREFAALLREHGYDARRGQQFAGGSDSPDVICEALGWLHIEVKRVQNLNLTDACVQAEGDQTGSGLTGTKSGRTKKLAWIVAHRRNHAPWLITMRAEFFFDLIREFEPAVLTQNREARRVAPGESGVMPPHSIDGAHGVTRPTTTIFRRDAEKDPRDAGATNNNQIETQKEQKV